MRLWHLIGLTLLFAVLCAALGAHWQAEAIRQRQGQQRQQEPARPVLTGTERA